MAIGRERILDAAIVLLDEVGIDNLTTRRLADKLKVQQPALYWHFKNKRALLDAINSEILVRHHTYGAPRPGDSWRSFLVNSSRSFRNALLAHRDGGRVHVGTHPEPRDLAEYEQQLQLYVEAGLNPGAAMVVSLSVNRFIIGSVLEEQAEDDQPSDPEMMEVLLADFPILRTAMTAQMQGTEVESNERAFETGLEVFIAGIHAMLAGKTKTVP